MLKRNILSFEGLSNTAQYNICFTKVNLCRTAAVFLASMLCYVMLFLYCTANIVNIHGQRLLVESNANFTVATKKTKVIKTLHQHWILR